MMRGEKRGNSQTETDGGGFSLALGTSSGEGGCETFANVALVFVTHLLSQKWKNGG